jgi:hypothetical protein
MKKSFRLALFSFLQVLVFSTSYVMAAPNEIVYAVTQNNSLLKFSLNAPSVLLKTLPIKDLESNEKILAIDFRPCLCGVYALSSAGKLYDININNGEAKPSFNGGVLFDIAGFQNDDFDIEFDPARNQLIVLSSSGLRYIVKFTYPNGQETPVVTKEPNLIKAGTSTSPGVNAAAFSNNFENAPSTMLYYLNATTSRFGYLGSNPYTSVDPVPNVGTETSNINVAFSTQYPVGFDVGDPADVKYVVSGVQTGENISSLYTIDVTTGSLNRIGTIGSGVIVNDITVGLSGDIEFEKDVYEVNEEVGIVNITLVRTGGLAGEPSAIVKALPISSAQQGKDFNFDQTSVIFRRVNGTPTEIIEVPVTILKDSSKEKVKEIILSVEFPGGGAGIGKLATTKIRINDGDTPPSLSPSKTPAPTPSDGDGSEIVSTTYDGYTVSYKKTTLKNFIRGRFSPTIQCTASCSANGDISISKSFARKNKIKNSKISSFYSTSNDLSQIKPRIRIASLARKKLANLNRLRVTMNLSVNTLNSETASKIAAENITFSNPRKKNKR